MTVKVLFVCLGNICRSPTAHGVFEHRIRALGLESEVLVDSAGTAAWHVGNPPDSRSSEAARTRGYELDHLRARQAIAEDFERFDYVLAMDNENLSNLQALAPESHSATLALFLDYAKGFSEREVPDPYYGGQQGFEHVLDLVEDAAQGLLEDMETRFGVKVK